MAAHDELDSILDAERAEARAARRDAVPDDDGPTAADAAGLGRRPHLDQPEWRDA